MVSFIYGDCTPHRDDEPSCLPPIDLQVSPPCRHLALLARDKIWRHRRVRRAPVGEHDNAPVLLSTAAQIKVYTATNDQELSLRALRVLRSANKANPVIDVDEPFPAMPVAVLEGKRACSGS
jgi:hypothetical protein